MNPWMIMLDEWRSQGNFGLTLPFIYGGMLTWPGDPLGQGKTHERKFEIFLRLLSEPIEPRKNLRLSFCDKANDLTLAPVNGIPQGCDGIQSKEGLVPILWVQRGILPEGEVSAQELSRVLWARYGSALEEGRFSCSAGEYGRFAEGDLTLIAGAKQREN